MKKLLSIFLAIVLIITAIPLGAFEFKASAAKSGYYTYSVSGGKATITDVNTSIRGDITVPSTLGGYPVTSIGSYAFENCISLTSITIGDSVTSIGGYAFEDCTSLTSITIGDSVTSIGDYAFEGTGYYNNSSNWENGVLYIGNHLIKAKTSISGSYEIKAGTVTIAGYAFSSCRSLTSITIPNSVISIGYRAFYDCTSLESITVPFVGSSRTANGTYDAVFGYIFGYTSSSVSGTTRQYYTSSSSYYYYIPSSLKTVTITDATQIPYGAFYDCGSLTSITIGDSVTSIGDSAFYNCDSLTSITIGDSVTRIGSYAFYSCDSLTSITIPNSVTSIGISAFYGCTSLTSITLPFVGSSRTANGTCNAVFGYIFGYTSSSASGTTRQYYTSSSSYYYYIPSSLKTVTITDATQIPYGAFYGCSSLTSITIGDSVTSIGSDAFYSCDRLTSITIGDSVTSIGSRAFYYCNSLESVYITDIAAWCNISFSASNSNPLCYAENLYLNGELVTDLIIPNDVTTIKSYAFRNCTSLTSVSLGDSVTSIGDYAFSECYSLKNVYITDIAAWYNISFSDSSNPLCNGANLYLNGELVTDLIILNSVTTIKSFAFYNCDSLTSVTIPDSVKSIGSSAFRSCDSLTSITIGDSVTSIGGGAFYYCRNLTSVTIPDSVKSIGSSAFRSCDSLTSITIPDSVTSIGDWAFSDCRSLTSITIPDSVTSIGYRVFYKCTSLTSITIPDSVTSIDSAAFYNCDSLTSITIGNSVTSIGSSAFEGTGYYNNSSNWENGVLYIGNHLIEANTSLSGSYEIKAGTVTIADYAFYNCTSLTSVSIGNSVTSIGYEAFEYCDSLTTVYYRGNSEDKAKISIGSSNSKLTDATWYYNACIGSADHTYGDDLVCDECGHKNFVLGDIDGTGEVDMEDVSVLAKYLAGWKVDCNQAALDVSGDGVVNLFDLVYLSQYVAGWDVTLH